MAATLFVPSAGTTQARVTQEDDGQIYRIDVRPTRARYTANDYREADELELTLSYDDAGVDPRVLKSCEVYFWMGDAADDGSFAPSLDNQRFIGIARTVDREIGINDGRLVRIRALDYTTLFLEARSFPPAGIPDFSQTLQSAWERICDNTGYWDLSDGTPKIVSTVQALKNRLQLIDVPTSTTLGDAVPARIKKLGKLQAYHKADAWAVWRTAVESLGLVTYIRGDRCIVTHATDFYTSDDPPRIVAGTSIVHLHESRDQGALSGKGLCLRSFDPLAGRTLEAFWPPQSAAPKKKRLGASANAGGAVIESQDYEFMESPFPCADQVALQTMTQRAWEERSRQELRGTAKVVEMFVDTVNGIPFDLLKLQAGDALNVEIDREALGTIQRLPTIGQRAAFLRDVGYSAQLAQYVVDNLDAITRMPPQFLVRSIATEIEMPTGVGGNGSYESTIEFVNRIQLDGSALTQASGTRQAPMRDQSDAVTPSPSGERSRNDRTSRKGNTR
jgi:hypothetical protein